MINVANTQGGIDHGRGAGRGGEVERVEDMRGEYDENEKWDTLWLWCI